MSEMYLFFCALSVFNVFVKILNMNDLLQDHIGRVVHHQLKHKCNIYPSLSAVT